MIKHQSNAKLDSWVGKLKDSVCLELHVLAKISLFLVSALFKLNYVLVLSYKI